MISLERRLSGRLAVALAILIAGVTAGAYLTLRSVLQSELDAALLSRVRMLTAPTAPGGSGFSLHFVEGTAAEFQPGSGAEYFEVRGGDGAVVDQSPSLAGLELAKPAPVGNRPVYFDTTLPGDLPGRAVALALGLEGSPTASVRPEFVVTLARSTAHQRDVLRAATAGFAVGGVLLILAAFRIVRTTTRAGLRPVAELARRVTAIEATSLDRRIPKASAPSELVPVVEQLNSLLDRLRSAFERERRFSANVAHELLTPVSELQALAENAIRWPGDPEATASLATDVLESTRYMDRTVRTLLALARNERGDAKLVAEPVDLGRLLEELCIALAVRAGARGVTLDSSSPETAAIRSDGSACRTLFQNLLENAVEYCPAGGQVRVALEVRDGAPVVVIGNSNNHLESGDLPRLTEPFWRKDGARSDRVHAGLGLALVDSLARLLGAGVHFELPRPQWFEARVHFLKS